MKPFFSFLLMVILLLGVTTARTTTEYEKKIDIRNRSKTSLNDQLTPGDKKKIGKCFDKCFPVQFPGCVPCRKCLFIRCDQTPLPKSGPCVVSCRNDCSRCPNVFKCVPVCLKLIKSLLFQSILRRFKF